MATARHRYATSPRGRRMHRHRQNRYRRRQAALLKPLRKINVTDQTSPKAGCAAMLAVARDPVVTMVVVCEVPGKEDVHGRDPGGAGGTETGGIDTSVAMAGVAGGASGVPEVVAVASV